MKDIGPGKQEFENISLSITLNICFGCSKESSQLDGSFKKPQHMLSLRNKKTNFLLR